MDIGRVVVCASSAELRSDRRWLRPIGALARLCFGEDTELGLTLPARKSLV